MLLRMGYAKGRPSARRSLPKPWHIIRADVVGSGDRAIAGSCTEAAVAAGSAATKDGGEMTSKEVAAAACGGASPELAI